MKVLFGYLFLFVLSIGFSSFTSSEIDNLSNNNIDQYGAPLTKFHSISSPYGTHSEHDFTLEIEEEDDKSKWLFFNVFKTNNNLNHLSRISKTNSAYLSKFITYPVSRYILLETFRL